MSRSVFLFIIYWFSFQIQNPRREILRIMQYLDLSLPDDIIDKIVELTSFKAMKNNPMANYSTTPEIIFDHSISDFMRKGPDVHYLYFAPGSALVSVTLTCFFSTGEVGDWINYFTLAQSQMFDENYARQMADVNIPFRPSI